MTNDSLRIKICGIQSADIALAASRAGADFLGFNFVENVRRQLQVDEGVRVISEYRSARESTESPGIVGLFRNQDVDWVNATARKLELDYLQICGDEDADYLSKVELPIFRQVRVRNEWTPAILDATVSSLLKDGHGVLLDSYDRNTPGGTGNTFDWSVAEGIATRDNVLLAGGLTPANVGAAITRLSPWGVDVASGVETDGAKDPDRIRAFIDAARAA